MFTGRLALVAPFFLAFVAQAPPQDLQAAYDDALKQLAAAQERKVELAEENARLREELETLKQARVDEAEAAVSDEERDYLLRSHYAAWRAFVADRPALRAEWQAYLTPPTPPAEPTGFELTDPPTTQPATQPATRPAEVPTTPTTQEAPAPTTAPAPE